MTKRDKLFAEAKQQIKSINPQKESLLYHNIYSLKMSNSYLYSTKQDVLELVDFLNSMD